MEAAVDTLAQQYLDALLDCDGAAARRLVEDAVGSGMRVEDVYLHVLQPALYEVGDRWANGEISVAQEHLATAVTEGVISGLAGSLATRDAAEGPAGRAIVTCTNGERHAMGARMVADFLAGAGWNVDYLAASTPSADIPRLAELLAADLVVLSTSLPWLLEEVPGICAALRALPRPPRIAVGGRAYGGDEELALRVGADIFARDPAQLLRTLAA